MAHAHDTYDCVYAASLCCCPYMVLYVKLETTAYQDKTDNFKL